MPSFAELLAQAEAEGLVNGRSEVLPAGEYQMYVEGVKSGHTKAGDPSIGVRWKTSTGQVTYQNLNLIANSRQGQAITISNLIDLGVTREFLARVDVSAGLEPLVPELIRVTQGRWFTVKVTVKKDKDWTNNNFYIQTASDPSVATAVQQTMVPQVQAAPVAAAYSIVPPQPVPAQPVYAPAPPVAQPAAIPQPQPVAIPQPAVVPQPAPVDPATGLAPRPGQGI